MSNDYDQLWQRLETESREKSEAVRRICIEAGRPDVLAQYDEAVRLNRLGITRARAVWHSISAAQRAVLKVAGEFNRLFLINGEYMPGRPPGEPKIRVRTVRNLCDRNLLAWDGGVFVPENAAVITEHGRFVLKHRLPDGERFTG